MFQLSKTTKCHSFARWKKYRGSQNLERSNVIQAKRSLGGKRLIGRKEQDMIKFQYIYIFDAYSFPDHDLFCGWLILVVFRLCSKYGFTRWKNIRAPKIQKGVARPMLRPLGKKVFLLKARTQQNESVFKT